MLGRVLLLCVYLSLVYGQDGPCPNEWTYDDKSNSCLKAFQNKKNWEDARKECQANDGDLVQPNSIATQMLTQGLLKRGNRYWIGIRDDDNNGHYHYMSGREVANFKRWAGGEPSNHGGNELCVEMIGNRRGSWNDKYCHKKRFYVCQNPVPQGVECEEGWSLTEKEDACVKVFNNKRNWSGARKECKDNNGDLVRIDSFETNMFVLGLLEKGNRYWLGMTDTNNDRVFEYMDGAVMRPDSYTPWAHGEPNDKGNNEDCIEIYANKRGAWNDRRCQRKWRFICEKKPQPKLGQLRLD